MRGKKEQKDEISRKILSQDLSDRLATINEICDGFKNYRTKRRAASIKIKQAFVF